MGQSVSIRRVEIRANPSRLWVQGKVQARQGGNLLQGKFELT